MFSTKDTILAGTVFLIPPAVFNFSIHFLQDIVLTLILYIVVGLWLTPIILKLIINKDPYTVLTYKNLLSSDKRGKNFNLFTLVLLGITVALNIVGVWFGLLKGFDNLVMPAPFFNQIWLNYVYLALVLVNFMVAITIEHKLYYGVISTFVPDNVIGYLSVVLYQTSHYIAFAFVITSSDAYAGILLALLFVFFLGLYILKEKETYKSSTLSHQIVALVNLTLLAVFIALKYHGKFTKGIYLNLRNSNNVINRIMH